MKNKLIKRQLNYKCPEIIHKFHRLYSTAVRHISLNKSVFAHGHGLSDVANSKHFYVLRSNF